MKNNKEILNEAFFKKPTYSEKVAKKMPQYKPVDSSKDAFGTQLSVAGNEPALLVRDTDEVKKRLAGTFGATFGNNSVKSMASRSIKTFPIIVSDNLDADTCVMLKRLLEDQYAEILNLLISNQVIDLSAYTSDGENGNIAIQALDTISGSDFRASRVADKANRTGEMSYDDIFANVPLYNLLRENGMVLDTGDSLLNAILEDACVIPSNETGRLVEYINENAQILAEVTTPTDDDKTTPTDPDKQKKEESGKPECKIVKLEDYLYNQYMVNSANPVQSIATRDLGRDALRGLVGIDNQGKEVYNKLTNANILVDREQLDASLNRSVGEYICDPRNRVIRDKFEKATYLLESGMIAGIEYVDYLTLRLGIPVPKSVRQNLIVEFKTSDVAQRFFKGENGKDFLDKKAHDNFVKYVSSRERLVRKSMDKIFKIKLSGILGYGAVGAATAGGAATISAVASGTGIAALLNPIILLAVAGAAIGSGAYLLYKIIKRTNDIKNNKYNKIEGWERVEALIEKLERNRAEVIASGYEEGMSEEDRVIRALTGSETRAHREAISKMVDTYAKSAVLKEDLEHVHVELVETFNMDRFNDFLETFNEALEECEKDPEYKATALSEAITSTVPMKIKYVEKKPEKDLLIAPEFAARSSYAYGSTEVERRDNKDRRYNQPLIMTVKFKERFSDGKFADNELTAVIGILGKIIRVPSEEMKYILKSNAEGETLRGVFMGNGKISNLVGDLLNVSKISKDVKALPQSADMWKNLEKVATLAAANKMTGKKNNNIANAHIVFSQKEVDELRSEDGIDYLRDMKLVGNLMKRYSAFTVMVANDAGQKVHIYDDLDDISWNVVPYSALMGKDSGDQLAAALAKLGRI